MSASQFIKQFDLFSKPFVFFVGDKKNKSTFIGGVLSLSIIIVSIVYFYYMMSLYFSDEITPKITESIIFENDMITLMIEENFLIFEMLINGEPLKQYEKKVGKTFLTYHVYYEQYDEDGNIQYEEIPLIECTSTSFIGYQCVNENSILNKNIYLQPIKKVSSDYALAVHLCNPELYDNCASEEEIYSTILQSVNYFQMFTKIKQYNPTSREYKDGFKSEYFYFDLNSLVYTHISLIKAQTSVKEGFLIQTTQERENIFNYDRKDTFFSKENIYDRMGIEGFAYIVFELNQITKIIVIQHAMITEVLAQFMSIFNSLLTIGILARFLAETHIVQDMNSILLKEYYKKTALMLVKRKENQLKVEIEEDSYQSEANSIVNMQKQINDTNFSEENRKYFKISFFDRFCIFFKQLIGQQQEGKFMKSDKSDSGIYKKLLKQSLKRINIFEVYKDLIKLKMAIKLILTKEQYAAIQFCGSQILTDDKTMNTLFEEKGKQVNDKFKTSLDLKSDNLPQEINKGQDKNKVLTNKEIPSSFSSQNQQIGSPTRKYLLQNQVQIDSQKEFQIDSFQKKVDNTFFKVGQQTENNSTEKQSKNEQQAANQDTSSQIQTQIDNNADTQKKNRFMEIEVNNCKECSQYSPRQQEQGSYLFKPILQKNNLFKVNKGDQEEIQFDSFEENKVSKENQPNIEMVLSNQPNKDNKDDKNEYQDNQNKLKARFKASKGWNQSSHLSQMDKIEENEEAQITFLNKFLSFASSNKLTNQIDLQIYESLIQNVL